MSSRTSLYQYTFHGSHISIAPEYKKLLSNFNLQTPNSWTAFNKGTVLSTGTTTCIKVTIPEEPSTFYFKRYDYSRKPWVFFIRRSKAANEFLNYRRFYELGIPTLKTVALFEKRTFGILNTACIVTEEMPNTMQLDNFFTDTLSHMQRTEQLRIINDIKHQLFTQLRTAHNAGIFHLDLKWRNILIQKNGGKFIPVWIDSPRGKKRTFLKYRLIVTELSGLARKALLFFTAKQLYKMLYIYLGSNATKQEARKLFFDISKHLSRRPPKGYSPNL